MRFPYGCICRKKFFDKTETTDTTDTTIWKPGLRAAAGKNQQSTDKSEFMDFFIFCPEKPFGELLSKITIKLSVEFSFLRNLAKRESSCSGTTRH